MVYPTTTSQETRRASRVAQRYALLHFPETLKVRRWLAAGLSLLVAAVTLYVVDPVDMVITWQLSLIPGTIAYKVWEHPPEALFIRAFVFNVTNPEAFLRGEEKIHVQQIGPFVYREVTSFNNLTLNENGTATFFPHRYLEFYPNKSIGYPQDFVVNTFNIPLLGAATVLSDSALVTNLALRSIAMFLGASPFLRLTVEDLFWGYDDPLISMAHSIAPFFVDFQRLGLLDRMYAGEDVVTIFAGRNGGGDPTADRVENGAYSIDTFNGARGFPYWGHGKPRSDPETGVALPNKLPCDTVNGSFEGYIFPRHVIPGQRMYVYRKPFCRSLPLEQVSEGSSPEGYHYLLYEGYPPALLEQTSKDNLCYCTISSGISGGCMPSGFAAVSPCYYHLPLALSLPHMLYADESVTNMIEGNTPSHDKHMSFMKLQPDLGIPLEIRCRMQINLMMGKTRLSLTQPFDNMALPIIWLDMELTQLPPFVETLMWLALKVGPILQTLLIAGCAIVGVAMLARAFVLRRRAATYKSAQPYAQHKLSVLQ